MKMENSEVVTPQELAAMLKVPVSWVYQRTSRGPEAIPFFKVGKYVRFHAAEVIAFLKKQEKGDAV